MSNPKIEIDENLFDEAMDAVGESPSEEIKIEEPSAENVPSQPSADEYKERWIRVTADFDNFRKRIQKEKSDQIKYGNETLIKELLPVIDNFERALATSKHSQNDSFSQGVLMIKTQLVGVLERFGLTSDSALGKIFDPNLHEAMSYKEDDSAPLHTVLEEHQKMFFLNKKLIRPALVTVAKNKEVFIEDGPTLEIDPGNRK